MRNTDYKDLLYWQKGLSLVEEIYKLTALLPKSETYGLASQLQRAAVSIPSNIAEGRRRGSYKEYGRFLHISFGSGAELETLIEILKRLPIGQKLEYTKIDKLLDEVMRMLNKAIQTINQKS